MSVLIAYVTTPDLQTARRIAQTLVEESLAACCNVLPEVESIYRWEGNVETAHECLMIVKTTQERFPALRDRIAALHSYEVPEIIAAPITDGLDAYLNWVRESVK